MLSVGGIIGKVQLKARGSGQGYIGVIRNGSSSVRRIVHNRIFCRSLLNATVTLRNKVHLVPQVASNGCRHVVVDLKLMYVRSDRRGPVKGQDRVRVATADNHVDCVIPNNFAQVGTLKVNTVGK
jgi:hypothetical protein